MNTPRNPEPIVAAWLEEGPNELPESTRRAIAVATRTTTQRGRPIWTPWRTRLMNPFSKVALAALAVVAIVGGGFFLLSPGSQVGGPSPAPSSPPASPPPSPAPQGPVPTAWTTYSSSRFAYSIDYPADWVATPATADWLISGLHPEGKNLDRFALTPTGTRVLVSSTAITDAMSSADRIAQLDAINAVCQLSDRHEITLDGATARQEDFFCFGVDYGIEVVAANEGRHFQIDLFSQTPLGEADRAIFQHFLESFRFEATSGTVTIDRSEEEGYLMTVPSSWNSVAMANGIHFSPPAPITTAAMWVGQATAGQYTIDVSAAYGGGPYNITGKTVAELLASVNSIYVALNSSPGTAERQVTVDEEPAWVTEHEIAGPRNLWIDSVVIHGERAYNLTMDAPPESADELRAAFDEITASIRWTN